jgi:hypothetical protein
MIEEGWSLEEFAGKPELRNIYCQFLWGFPLERFDFVGISEDYAQELADFARRILCADVSIAALNVNPEQGGSDYAIEAPVQKLIESLHAKDINLYQRALELRHRRP